MKAEESPKSKGNIRADKNETIIHVKILMAKDKHNKDESSEGFCFEPNLNQSEDKTKLAPNSQKTVKGTVANVKIASNPKSVNVK